MYPCLVFHVQGSVTLMVIVFTVDRKLYRLWVSSFGWRVLEIRLWIKKNHLQNIISPLYYRGRWNRGSGNRFESPVLHTNRRTNIQVFQCRILGVRWVDVPSLHIPSLYKTYIHMYIMLSWQKAFRRFLQKYGTPLYYNLQKSTASRQLYPQTSIGLRP